MANREKTSNIHRVLKSVLLYISLNYTYPLADKPNSFTKTAFIKTLVLNAQIHINEKNDDCHDSAESITGIDLLHEVSLSMV